MERHGSPCGQRCGVRRRRLGLNPDDVDIRAARLDGGGDTGKESAATGRHDDGADFGRLLDDLQPTGALARHDVHMVEGVDQGGARPRGELSGRNEALVYRVADELDVGAVRARRLLFRDRCSIGHEHRRFDPQQGGRERHPLGMISRTRRDDPTSPFLAGQAAHPHVSATNLERPRPLEVLALDRHLLPCDGGQPPRTLHRGHESSSHQRLASGLDFGQSHQRVRLIGRHLVGGSRTDVHEPSVFRQLLTRCLRPKRASYRHLG